MAMHKLNPPSDVECQAAKRNLEESNQRLTVFADSVAHELRDPLHVILGYCVILNESGFASTDIARSQLNRIVAGAKRMHSTIETLLQISSLNGEISTDEGVDLNDCANTAIENLKVKIDAARAHINIDDLPAVRGNRGLIVQLFQNLIANAVKFRGTRAPAIKISAELDEETVRLSVSDNGIGIDPAHFDGIFEYFKRLNSRDKYEGSGLGLTICKRIVEIHHGRIWVDSVVGLGSTLVVELPAQRSAFTDKNRPIAY